LGSPLLLKNRVGWLALLVALLCASTNIRAQWKSIPGLSIGHLPIESSAITYRDGVLWAGSLDLVRSSDSGATWQTIPLATDGSLDRINDIQFLDKNNGLITSYFSVWLTTDGGTNWKELLDANAINGGANACFLGSPDSIAVSDFGGDVYISTNRGNTWSIKRIDTNATQLLYRRGILYALTARIFLPDQSWAGIIHTTSNGGQTWQEFPGRFNADSYSFAFDSCGAKIYLTNEGFANPGDTISQIAVSSDQGATWQTAILNDREFFAGSIATGPNAIYTTTTKGSVFRSEDGINWASVNGPNSQIDSRALCVVNDSLVFVIDQNGGIWRTVNSGGMPLDNPYIPPHVSSTALFTTDTISVCSDGRRSILIFPGTGLVCTAPAVVSTTITGTDSKYFTIVYAPPLGTLSLDSVAVRFQPDASREFHANLTIALADGKVFTVALIGHGRDSTFITLTADTLVTDTVGEITLPILIHGGIPSSFDFRISWDTAILEYLGTYDALGTKIDRAIIEDEHIAIIHVTASEALSLDTVVYARFRFYPGVQQCAAVRFDSAYFWPDTTFCGKIAGLYDLQGNSTVICASKNCAIPYLSEFLRTRTITFRIAPNPAMNFVEITSSLPVANASIQILNALGEIEQSVIADLSTAPHTLDLTGLASGVKFVRVVGEGYVRTVPILLAR
jgi:photosystem II stability/assembly factor-like uncharacterized protein